MINIIKVEKTIVTHSYITGPRPVPCREHMQGVDL